MNSSPISLLIVESQPMMRSALGSAFAADGIRVVAELAESSEAVRAAKNSPPDVVLISVNQPGLRDMQEIAALREGLPGTAIVALVTGEFRGQESTALAFGANLVINKHSPRIDLIRAVRKLLKMVH